MRKQLDEIKQLGKCIAVNLHRDVFSVKHDAVLIVIYVRRVLKSPFLSLDRDRDDAVILPCGMVHASCIALVLHAELAFRVRG